MVVNFRARGISRGAHKLAWTPTLNKKTKKKKNVCLLTLTRRCLIKCRKEELVSLGEQRKDRILL
jgi:hypothetical protein